MPLAVYCLMEPISKNGR